jgi:hypothetical protein
VGNADRDVAAILLNTSDCATISSVDAEAGPVAGARVVTIHGTHLSGAISVTFGGTAATSFTVDSPAQITATTPAHAAGAVDVVVQAGGGTATSVAGYTFVDPPAVNDISPSSGPLGGGQVVTITGTNLTTASSVMFDGIPATSFNVDSSTQITATSPAHTTAVTVSVEVTTAGGAASAPYTYLAFAPANVVATATSTSAVTLTWPAASGATSYQIWRSSLNAPYALVDTTGNTFYNDSGLSANTSYLYKLKAVYSSATSGFSAMDAATTVVFTDAVLGSTVTAKTAHVIELRTAVNALRAAAGLGAATFTDPVLTPQSSRIKAMHITELRSAFDAARSALALFTTSYTDPVITAGTTTLKAAHLMELRSGVQ